MTEQIQIDFDSTDGLTREEWLVWETIRIHPGEASAITGDSIAEITGIKYDRVRAVIRHLVNKHNFFIGSSSKGYYVPVSAEETVEIARSLRCRGISILIRASKIQKTSLEEIYHQARMEFKEVVK